MDVKLSKYDLQATSFLKKTKTEFKAVFVEHGKHFDDDKESRDIYDITLSRGERSFSFRFGQSIRHSGRWIMDITADGYHKGQGLTDDDYKVARRHFFTWGKVTSRNTDFEEPTPYSVLAGLTNYDPGNLENFCGDFGYDTDSRKAEKVYKAVVNEYRQLCMLYSDEEMQELAEIS